MSDNPQVYSFRRREAVTAPSIEEAKVDNVKGFTWPLDVAPWLALVLVMSGFCLGRAEVLGGLFPFGPAFAVAAPVSFRRYGWIYIIPLLAGYCTSMGFVAAMPYIFISLVLLGLFCFYRVDAKKQWLIMPMVTLAAVAVGKTLPLLFGTFVAYDLMIALFESLFAAAMCLVMMITFNSLKKIAGKERLSTDELVCLFVVLLGMVSGLGSWQIAGISVLDVASRFLVVLAALWGGAGAGAGVGALMGIIPSLSSMSSPSIVGVYAFAGLLAGAFNSLGRIGIALGFGLGNILLCLYLASSQQISNHLLTSLVALALLFLVPGSWLKNGEKLFSKTTLKSSREERGERLLRITSRRLQTASNIFNDLAKGCREVAATEPKAEENNVEIVLNHLVNQICENCSVKQICWKIDFEDTYKGVMGLFSVAEKEGKAGVRDVPENFRKRCPHLRELVATINCLYELYCRSNYWQAQRQGTRLLMASQMAGTAEVLEKLGQEISGRGREREILERELGRSLVQRGLPIDAAYVVQMADKTIDLWINYSQCPGEDKCCDMLKGETSRLLNRNFRVHDMSCGVANGERCRYRLLEAGACRLSIGKAQLAKEGNEVCGDCGGSVLLEEGRQLLMISDGMGTGARAAFESGVALDILSSLLEVGFKRDTAIDTINTVLMLRGREESFVTLDICLVDLYSGGAEFIKTGGAASFIKRGCDVEVVKAASLPVGMLQTVEKEVIYRQLSPGDMVIMASDGLLDADNQIDIQWLVTLLAQADFSDAQELAEFLLTKAVSLSGGRLKDDITILVSKLDVA